MLHDLQNDAGKRKLLDCNTITPASSAASSKASLRPPQYVDNPTPKASASTLSLPRPDNKRSTSSTSIYKLSSLEPTILETEQRMPALTLTCLVAFYPPTDFRISREEKRQTNVRPEKNLPPALTNLFDESYLSKTTTNVADPYLSPAAAPTTLLKAAYPQDIVLYTCEYDMLNAEGIAFGERLVHKDIAKTVHGGLIKEMPHAFDKKPNPWSFPKAADKCYSEACAELTRVFGGVTSLEERAQLNEEVGVDRFVDEELLGEGDRLMSESERKYGSVSAKGKGKEEKSRDEGVGARLDEHYRDV